MTSPGLAKAPLRLICLPLCRKPELIYYYAHKRREPRSQSSQSSEGKGKLRQMLESREAVTATSSSSRDAGATLGSGPGVASTSTQQEHQVSYGQQIARRISQVTSGLVVWVNSRVLAEYMLISQIMLAESGKNWARQARIRGSTRPMWVVTDRCIERNTNSTHSDARRKSNVRQRAALQECNSYNSITYV